MKRFEVLLFAVLYVGLMVAAIRFTDPGQQLAQEVVVFTEGLFAEESDPAVEEVAETEETAPADDETSVTVSTDTAPVESPSPDRLPEFDVVRVERSGDAVIAGTAAPGTRIILRNNGVGIAETVATDDGDWVIVLEQPLPPGAHDVSLEGISADGGETSESTQMVAIVVPEKPTEDALVVIAEAGGASSILQIPEGEDDLEIAAIRESNNSVARISDEQSKPAEVAEEVVSAEDEAVTPEAAETEVAVNETARPEEELPAEEEIQVAVSDDPGIIETADAPAEVAEPELTADEETETAADPVTAEEAAPEPVVADAEAATPLKSDDEAGELKVAATGTGTEETAVVAADETADASVLAEEATPAEPAPDGMEVALAAPAPQEEPVAESSDGLEEVAATVVEETVEATLETAADVAETVQQAETPVAVAETDDPVETPESVSEVDVAAGAAEEAEPVVEEIAEAAATEPDEAEQVETAAESLPVESDTVLAVGTTEPVAVEVAEADTAPAETEPVETASNADQSAETDVADAAVPESVVEEEAVPGVETAQEAVNTEGETPVETADLQQQDIAPQPEATAVAAPEPRVGDDAPAEETAVALADTGETTEEAEPSVSAQAASPSDDASAEAVETASAAPDTAANESEQTSESTLAEHAAEPAGPEPQVLVQAVEIENGEQLFVAGTVATQDLLLIYIGDELLGQVRPFAGGRWLLETEKMLEPGEYSIRADQVSASGEVIARAEVTFLREEDEPVLSPVTLVASASGSAGSGQAAKAEVKKPRTVIIRRGDNLWTISRRLYGRGIRFTTIYQANQGQIRNPGKIWPGQVFIIPESDEAWTEEG